MWTSLSSIMSHTRRPGICRMLPESYASPPAASSHTDCSSEAIRAYPSSETRNVKYLCPK